MFEFLAKFFVIAGTFTSSLISSLPINKPDVIFTKKVAITTAPTPVKLEEDEELLKLKMEAIWLEEQYKNLTATEISTTPTPIKSGLTPTPTKSRPTPKLTLKPSSSPKPTPKPTGSPTPTETPKSTDKSQTESDKNPTPTPLPIPADPKQFKSTKGLNADTLFSMINDYRASFGLEPFKQDEEICTIAKNRAPQVYEEIYGTTPMHYGLKAMQVPYYINEIIVNYTTEQEAFNWWITDQSHHDIILSDYEYSCVACHEYSCTEIFTNYVPK